ncbi:MAG: LPS assembly lipoprotein LptE [Candidatus Methylomirabilales bacterium]
MKKGLVLIGLGLIPALGGACGYHGQVSLPGHLKRIHLTVSNPGAFRPGLETDLTQALTQRILSAGGRVVKEEGEADAAMKATITALERNPVSFDSTDIARRFRMVVVLDLQVVQRSGKVELANEQVRGEAYYSAPPGVTGTQVAEDEAVRRALRNLADQVVTRVVEPF